MVQFAASFAVWLGASLVVLADGRRGLAAGVAFSTAGLATLALVDAGAASAIALVAGGAVATARRWLAGPPGWAIMPAGSTPRLVMCVATGLVALWVAAVVTQGDGAAVRFAVMVGIGLAAARVLWSDDPWVVLTAVAVLAMSIAVAAGLAPASPGWWPYGAAALLAAGTAVPPIGKPRAA